MRNRLAPSTILLFAFTLTAQSPSEVEITAEPGHHFALENEYVRVFKVEVAPHSATLMHRHRHDYIYVTLGAARVENDVAASPGRDHSAGWRDALSPRRLCPHCENPSDQPFRNITIELMQDERAHRSPPPNWDEERGLHILNGGTQDILFVKDGARASELQLQPGGVLPKHHHAGPHLVVAVTDLDFRSDIEGKGTSKVQLKAGNVAWVKGGFTHTLTNVGSQNAKLITLEFH
jgi:quercetin dioxygenase-like cupin family protein